LSFDKESERPLFLTIFTGPISSFYKLFASFLFYRDDTNKWEEYYELQNELQLNVMKSNGHGQIHGFISGLAAFRSFRQTKDPKWLKRGQESREKMNALSEQGCKWNFEQKLLMLAAEESYCLGDCNAAEESYKNAITAANGHRFLNDECFALELAASFYIETGDLSSSLEHYRQAHERYMEWGAYAKANQLLHQINENFN
jgi:hypothetical protein